MTPEEQQKGDSLSEDIGYIKGLLEGLTKSIDCVNEKLDRQNGRLRTLEGDMTKVKTLGAVLGFVAGIIGAYIKGLITPK